VDKCLAGSAQPLVVITEALTAPLVAHMGTPLRMYDAMCASPGKGGLGIFVAGLGLGLLLASAFSTFWWWWAVGMTLFLAMTSAAVLAATRG
jgi:hypothetical protein